MSSTRKRHRVEEVDRISNLPGHLIDYILRFMPNREVGRTAILSKTWRNIWRMYPELVLGSTFHSQLLSKEDKQAYQSEFSRAIDTILLNHCGPILKFVLYIPPHLHLHQSPYFSKHIGVHNLNLINSDVNASYEMPPYLFDCSELTQLLLRNWKLNPPLKFVGFCNLLTLELFQISFTADMSFGTRLVNLRLSSCTGIEHLGCQFMKSYNLRRLTIFKCKEVDWKWFECTQKLNYFNLALHPDFNKKKNIDISKLLGSMPRICSLKSNGFSLKCLEPDVAIPKMLTKTMENLKYLELQRLMFYDMRQLSSTFCLIRSSPNLQNLVLDLESKDDVSNLSDVRFEPCATFNFEEESKNPTELTIERYLRSVDCMDMVLRRLQTVKIIGAMGSRAKFHFVKLLLSSSPSLKRMTVDVVGKHTMVASFVHQEVMLFAGKSSAAEITWISFKNDVRT